MTTDLSDLPRAPRRLGRADLRRIYEAARTIAVVGASAREGRPAHYVPAYLASQGYRVVPVNPRGGEWFGERVRPSLADIGEPIDVVDVFRPPEEGSAIVRAASDAGARVVWFQPGTESPEATAAAADAGLAIVTRLCMGVTHGTLGLGPGAGEHGDASED
ncbi:MAG TPA: CoA-binding protein [Candidatus Angelobacter sp.]|nr:CoA-binding protein [Candidatus Angelobacter sp.]